MITLFYIYCAINIIVTAIVLLLVYTINHGVGNGKTPFLPQFKANIIYLGLILFGTFALLYFIGIVIYKSIFKEKELD